LPSSRCHRPHFFRFDLLHTRRQPTRGPGIDRAQACFDPIASPPWTPDQVPVHRDPACVTDNNPVSHKHGRNAGVFDPPPQKGFFFMPFISLFPRHSPPPNVNKWPKSTSGSPFLLCVCHRLPYPGARNPIHSRRFSPPLFSMTADQSRTIAFKDLRHHFHIVFHVFSEKPYLPVFDSFFFCFRPYDLTTFIFLLMITPISFVSLLAKLLFQDYWWGCQIRVANLIDSWHPVWCFSRPLIAPRISLRPPQRKRSPSRFSQKSQSLQQLLLMD